MSERAVRDVITGCELGSLLRRNLTTWAVASIRVTCVSSHFTFLVILWSRHYCFVSQIQKLRLSNQSHGLAGNKIKIFIRANQYPHPGKPISSPRPFGSQVPSFPLDTLESVWWGGLLCCLWSPFNLTWWQCFGGSCVGHEHEAEEALRVFVRILHFSYFKNQRQSVLSPYFVTVPSPGSPNCL